MADAGARRHDAEIAEGRLAPAQEAVALAVPLVFELDVAGEGARVAEIVDDDRMVDDEIDRHQRIDAVRIAAERLHRVAHRREVDHRRHAGEVLHQHARRAEGDLAVAPVQLQPVGDAADVVGRDRAPVLAAEEVLEQHLEREGQAGDAGKAVLLGLGEAVIVVAPVADGEGLEALEAVAVGAGHGRDLSSMRWRGARARKLGLPAHGCAGGPRRRGLRAL